MKKEISISELKKYPCISCTNNFLSKECKEFHTNIPITPCIRCYHATSYVKSFDDYEIFRYCDDIDLFKDLDMCGRCFNDLLDHFLYVAVSFIRNPHNEDFQHLRRDEL